MSETFSIVTLFGSFFLLIFLRVPIAFGLLFSSLITAFTLDISPITLAGRIYTSMNYYPLLAIPLFIFAGYLMGYGSITSRLLRFSESLLVPLRGSVAHVTVGTGMMLGGVSGASTADTAALGPIMIPAMQKSGYSKEFSVALTAAASTMGSVIPPSVLMVVYGAISGLSVGKLFLAGVVPGILIGVFQMVYAYYMSVRTGMPPGGRWHARDIYQSGVSALLPMGVPIVVVGGIVVGLFTATEAGAAAVVYVFLLQLFERSLRLRDLGKVIREATELVGLPLFAIAAATIFGWLIAYLRVPDILISLMGYVGANEWAVFAAICFLFFIAGMFIDGVPAMIIFLPIAKQAADMANIPPLQLGIVIVMMASLGLLTPPFGLCVLLAAKIGKIETIAAFRASLPFILLFMCVVILVIVFPDVALWLPNLTK